MGATDSQHLYRNTWPARNVLESNHNQPTKNNVIGHKDDCALNIRIRMRKEIGILIPRTAGGKPYTS